MQARLIPYGAAPELMRSFIEFSTKAVVGFDPVLAELVKIRASQINGCAFCLHMHSTDARKHGESEDRIVMLAAWHESPLYTDRERAALAWTEALTHLPDGPVQDAAYDALIPYFSEEERVQLTMAIALINAWNRFGAGFRAIHPVASARAAA
jgi:AhpD family alkylhydroperoxidase